MRSITRSEAKLFPILAPCLGLLLSTVAGAQGADPGDRALFVCGTAGGDLDTPDHPTVELEHLDFEDATLIVQRILWLEVTEAVRTKSGYHLVLPDEDTERVVRDALGVLDHPLLSWRESEREGATTGNEARDVMLNACRSFLRRDYAECLGNLRALDRRSLPDEWMRALVLQLLGGCCEEIATSKPEQAAPYIEEAEGLYKALSDRGFSDAFRLQGRSLLGALYQRTKREDDANREWKSILRDFPTRTKWFAYKWAELSVSGQGPSK